MGKEEDRHIGKKEDRQECLSHFDNELASSDRSCVLLDGSEQRIVPEAKRLAKEEAGEREGTPHPRVFSVRVANKGLREETLKVESSKLKGEKEEETEEAHLGDKRGVTSCKTLGLLEGYPPPGFV